MYDLWFTIGAAVMDPNLVTDLLGKAPVFNIVSRLIVEWSDLPLPKGAFYPPASDSITAGVLDATSTATIRKEIRTYLENNPVPQHSPIPPISIYTAGKMCQLLNVPDNKRFLQVLGPTTDNPPTGLNQAYKNALAAVVGSNPANFSTGFAGFLGLLAIDNRLAGKVDTPGDPDLIQAAKEFGLSNDATSNERKVLAAYATDPAFTTAQSLLTNGTDGPWRTSCGDQFLFWSPQNAHAIM